MPEFKQPDVQYLEAPERAQLLHPSVFLAGGITNCPDWQSILVRMLTTTTQEPMSIVNPRREDFPIGDPEAAQEQIDWEYLYLRTVNVVSFWFSRGSLNPIVLFELGSALERRQPLVVGVDREYPRIKDVEIQTSLRRPEIQLVYDLGDLASMVKYAFEVNVHTS